MSACGGSDALKSPGKARVFVFDTHSEPLHNVWPLPTPSPARLGTPSAGAWKRTDHIILGSFFVGRKKSKNCARS